MQIPQATASSPGFLASRLRPRSRPGSLSSPSWALTPGGTREPDLRAHTGTGSRLRLRPRTETPLPRGRVVTRYRQLSDRRPPQALPPAPDVHRQVDDEGDSRDGVPPAEGPGYRQLDRRAAVPVQDAGDEHVQGDEQEQQVRSGEADGPFGDRPGPDGPGGDAGESPRALG